MEFDTSAIEGMWRIFRYDIHRKYRTPLIFIGCEPFNLGCCQFLSTHLRAVHDYQYLINDKSGDTSHA
jgi:hypothetical protein